MRLDSHARYQDPKVGRRKIFALAMVFAMILIPRLKVVRSAIVVQTDFFPNIRKRLENNV